MLFAKLGNNLAGTFGVAGRIKGLIRGNDVHHMVSYARLLVSRGFGGTDIHVFVDLHGICADDVALEVLRQPDGNARFADTGGPADDDDFGLGGSRIHRSTIVIRT